VLTETVPDATVFVASGSTPGWSCADGAPAGTVCTLSVGALDAGGSGSATFLLRPVAPLPLGASTVANEVDIKDDGAHGQPVGTHRATALNPASSPRT